MTVSFDLLTEPWIPIERQDGLIQSFGLREAIVQSPSLGRISGGSPLETAVLYRVLLAVVQRVHDGGDVDSWVRLWKDPASGIRPILDYLDKWAVRFDLYGDYPFMQSNQIAPGTDKPAKHIYERASGNNLVFLDHAMDETAAAMTSADAARMLLVKQAYGGSHPGGINPITGTKDQMRMGPLCGRSVVLLSGDNLWRTLLLNLLKKKDDDVPAWERDDFTPRLDRNVYGPCDHYTRRSRLCRLKPSSDGRFCEGVTFYLGEPQLDESDPSKFDPQVPRRLTKDKKFVPFRLTLGRALWRDAGVFFATRETDKGWPLAALKMLAKRKHDVPDMDVTMRLLAVDAEAQGPSTDSWRDESLSFALEDAEIEERYIDLCNAIDYAEIQSSSLKKRAKRLSREYLSSIGSGEDPDPKNVDRLAEELGCEAEYFRLLAGEAEKLLKGEMEAGKWESLVKSLSYKALRLGAERLGPSIHRYRAEAMIGLYGIRA